MYLEGEGCDHSVTPNTYKHLIQNESIHSTSIDLSSYYVQDTVQEHQGMSEM